MSRVITYSQCFPSYHPRAGEQTFFVEKVLNQVESHGTYNWRNKQYEDLLIHLNEKKIKEGKLTRERIRVFYKSLNKDVWDKKPHTIRAGHSRKVGQMLTPAIWSGRPYWDPQIIFAQDMEVKKTWDFHIDVNGIYSINNQYIFYPDGTEQRLAENDGLTELDFMNWFIPDINKFKGFQGQIICWAENVNY